MENLPSSPEQVFDQTLVMDNVRYLARILTEDINDEQKDDFVEINNFRYLTVVHSKRVKMEAYDDAWRTKLLRLHNQPVQSEQKRLFRLIWLEPLDGGKQLLVEVLGRPSTLMDFQLAEPPEGTNPEHYFQLYDVQDQVYWQYGKAKPLDAEHAELLSTVTLNAAIQLGPGNH